jgi:hypothetical protein
MKPKLVFMFVIFGISLVLLGLSACGKSYPKVTSTVDLTRAYQTVGARLTQAVAHLPTSISPSPTSVSSIVSSLSPTPTPTFTIPPQSVSPSLTFTPLPDNTACDRAAAGYPKIDVTIDDDTPTTPGKTFTKIWRLTNVGKCTWTKDYAAVWFSGEKLGDLVAVPLGGEVKSGESVDIAVDMVAPMKPGTYQSNWKLRNAGNVLFGIGPNGDAPFWVRILVVEIASSTVTLTSTPSPTATPSSTPTMTGSPTPTPTITPPVLVNAAVSLPVGSSLDLDTAQTGTGEGDDLLYQDEEGFHLLVPQAGAVLGFFGGLPPSPENCRQASMSAAPLAVDSLTPGTYLCYRTSQGWLGRVRLVSLNSADFSINLDVLTWAVP